VKHQTGIVMEVNSGEVTVLSSTGEFRKVKIRGKMPELGAEISLPPIQVKKGLASGTWLGWLAAAAAVFLLFLSPWASRELTAPPMAVAYVTVDINPSIELAVDNNRKVISAKPWNDDGKKLLAKVSLVGKTAEEAVASLTEEAVKAGFIGKQKENTVVVTLDPGAKKLDPALETNLQKSARQILAKENLVGKVQTLQVDEQVLKVAKETGVSPGKLVILAELEAIKENKVSVQDLKNMSISQAIITAGGNPEEVIDKAHKDTQEGTIKIADKKFLAIDPVKNPEGVNKNTAVDGSIGKNDPATALQKPNKEQVVNTGKTMVENQPKETGQDAALTKPVDDSNGQDSEEPPIDSGDAENGGGTVVIPKPRVENGVYDPIVRRVYEPQL